jgi:tetratricopeptide (TPR) repeat protein
MRMKTRAACLFISVIILFSIAMPIHIFATDDVPSNWAVEQIEVLKSMDFGFPEIYQDYKKNITREEFAMLVCCLYETVAGVNAECGDLNAFIDISESPYRSEILKVGLLGIVNGIGKNKFNPDGEIDRQQMSVMLLRTIKVLRPDFEPVSDSETVFVDDSKIADWARPSVAYVYDNYILRGTGELTIEPLGKATREQALLLIFKTGFFTGLLNEGEILESKKYQISSQDDGIIEEIDTDGFESPEDYWNVGKNYSHELFMPKRAITAFNKALKMDSGFYRAHRDKAEAYFIMEMYDEGLSSAIEAIKLYEMDSWCYFQRGRLYYKKGEIDKAMEDFNRAIELVSANVDEDDEVNDADAEADDDADTKADSGVGSGADTGTGGDVVVDANAEDKAGVDTGVGGDAGADAGADAEVKTGVNTGTGGDVGVDPSAEDQKDPDASVDTDMLPISDDYGKVHIADILDNESIAQIHTYRALCLMKKTMFKKAVADFRVAAQLNPEVEEVLDILDIR